MNKLAIIVASGGGAAIHSSKDGVMFNDILGTTLGTQSEHGYASVSMTAFGDTADADALFTGKPLVDGLGHAFLFRNYRAGLGRWLTADPLGYPDGWNQMAYGVNSPLEGLDILGGKWGNIDFVAYYFLQDQNRPSYVDTDIMELTNAVFGIMKGSAMSSIDSKVKERINDAAQDNGRDSFEYNLPFPVNCGSIVWAMGGGTGNISGSVTYSWGISSFMEEGRIYTEKWYHWRFRGSLIYSDEFKDPVDILNRIDYDIEVIGGRPYKYGHTWIDQFFGGSGCVWRRMVE